MNREELLKMEREIILKIGDLRVDLSVIRLQLMPEEKLRELQDSLKKLMEVSK